MSSFWSDQPSHEVGGVPDDEAPSDSYVEYRLQSSRARWTAASSLLSETSKSLFPGFSPLALLSLSAFSIVADSARSWSVSQMRGSDSGFSGEWSKRRAVMS